MNKIQSLGQVRSIGASTPDHTAKLGNKFEKFSDRGWKAKFQPQPFVYFDDYLFEHLVRNDRKISSFWNVLSDQPICVFHQSLSTMMNENRQNKPRRLLGLWIFPDGQRIWLTMAIFWQRATLFCRARRSHKGAAVSSISIISQSSSVANLRHLAK